MFTFSKLATAAALLSPSVWATPTKRQLPAEPQGVKTITSPNGVEIRYKEPGKAGVLLVRLVLPLERGQPADIIHRYFEARENPETAPITLWLNGGPGSDSLIGLFQELGPCSITEDLKSQLNPYAWNNVSNMLFLSQPVDVGFSYGRKKEGYQNPNSGRVLDQPNNATTLPNEGRFSYVDPDRFDSTDISAVGTWEILQAFLTNLPKLDNTAKNRTFNLWTESYGGHYGPAFYDYFYQQNELIGSGEQSGVHLNMDTLGIINGIIDSLIQTPYYPEFARFNTYGIKAINETIYDFMKTAYYIPGGCHDYILYCVYSDKRTVAGQRTCQFATNICRGFVEEPYYYYGGRGVYDIRHPYDDPTPPDYFEDYLNQAEIQNALGVDLNYTQAYSPFVGRGFARTGDFVYRRFMHDLERILNNGVRVALIYGDADYICNWFGGEAVSMQLEYEHAKEFRQAGYEPFMVDGTQYGEVKEYGKFSFMRIYEAGHEVPYYQPKASLEAFRRVLGNLALADGSEAVTPTYQTNGTAETTHTESFVPLPSSASSMSMFASSGVPSPVSSAAFL
ncbi:uncharacterized protein LTR77_009422 [Saxophila tyrrhenica]|uniref:Carboxypeptidase n=1 Tax=Saxophila tyrrhenica TaxID=1690608 RepID=A0AAV9P0Z0_9PEZI|nr:hypothetical protein LTR77_009422 [Saxophila tyrrhenica]